MLLRVDELFSLTRSLILYLFLYIKMEFGNYQCTKIYPLIIMPFSLFLFLSKDGGIVDLYRVI